MSLFAQLNSGGIRQPDAVINGSSNLLPNSGAGIQLTTTKINQTSNLLGNISPYDYGPGRVSDDIVYKPVPHKIQKIVPQLTLPGMNELNFKLSHAVDDGDIAFALRTPHNARRDQVTDYNWFTKQHLGRAVDAIVNLPTLNYILAGLQYPPNAHKNQWENFYESVAVDTDKIKFDHFQDPLKKFHAISCFVRDCVRPIGIVIGSENQGGQHQGNGAGAVDWPTDFVVTILVQGLCDNTANHWRCCEISAGDDLMLALAHTFPSSSDLQSPHLRKDDQSCGEGWMESNFQKPSNNQTYTLNHWRYGTIRQTLTATANDFKISGLVELIPASTTEVSKPWLLQAGPNVAEGVWHIARSQVMASSFARHEMAHAPGYRDDMQNLRGGPLIECQVDPLWESINDNWWKHVFEKEKKKMIDELKEFIKTKKPTGTSTAAEITDNEFKNNIYKIKELREKWKETKIGETFIDHVDSLTPPRSKPKFDVYNYVTLKNFYDVLFPHKTNSIDINLLFFTAQKNNWNLFDVLKILRSKVTQSPIAFQQNIFNSNSDKIDNSNLLHEFFVFFYYLLSYSHILTPPSARLRLSTYIEIIHVQALMKVFTLQGEWNDMFLASFTKHLDQSTFEDQKNRLKQKNYTDFIEKLATSIHNKSLEISGEIHKEHTHTTQLFTGNVTFHYYSHIDDSTLPQSSNNTNSSFPTEPAQRASVPLSSGAEAGREEETAGAAKGKAAPAGEAGAAGAAGASGAAGAGDGGRAQKAARKGAVPVKRVGGTGGSSGARVLGGVRVIPPDDDE